jgi:hypothetical protein
MVTEERISTQPSCPATRRFRTSNQRGTAWNSLAAILKGLCQV